MERRAEGAEHTGDVGAEHDSPYGPDDRLAAFALAVFHVNGILMRNGGRIAGVAGQTSARWQVLGRAGHRPRTVAQMARELGLARQSVQGVADALEEAGMVAYVDNPTDRRARLVSITDRGAHVLGEIESANAAWARRLAPHLAATDLEQATGLLHRIGSAIERDLTDGGNLE